MGDNLDNLLSEAFDRIQALVTASKGKSSRYEWLAARAKMRRVIRHVEKAREIETE